MKGEVKVVKWAIEWEIFFVQAMRKFLQISLFAKIAICFLSAHTSGSSFSLLFPLYCILEIFIVNTYWTRNKHIYINFQTFAVGSQEIFLFYAIKALLV